MVNKVELSSKSVNGIVKMFTGVAGQQVVKISVIALLSRLLLPEEFGIVTAATVILNVSNLFAEIGLVPAIIQKKDIHINHIRTAYVIGSLIGVFFWLLLFFNNGVIENLFGISGLGLVVQIFSFSFIWLGVGLISEALLAREMKFGKISLIKFISFFLGYGVTAPILAYNNFSYWSLVYGQIIQSAISTILLVYVKKPIFGFDIKSAKELLILGGGFSLAKVINFSAIQGDKFIAGKFLGVSALGLYGKAYELMTFPTKLYDQIISKVALSAISKIQDDTKNVAKVFLRSTSITAFLGIPFTLILVQFGLTIIRLFFGPNWDDMQQAFYFLSSGIFFRIAYRLSSSILLARGQQYLFAFAQVIFASAILLGSYYGSINGGLELLSQCVLFSTILNYLILTCIVIYSLKINVLKFLLSHIQGVVIALFVYLFDLLLIRSVDLSMYLSLFITLAFLIVMYVIVTLLPKRVFLGEDISWFTEKLPFKLRSK